MHVLALGLGLHLLLAGYTGQNEMGCVGGGMDAGVDGIPLSSQGFMEQNHT